MEEINCQPSKNGSGQQLKRCQTWRSKIWFTFGRAVRLCQLLKRVSSQCPASRLDLQMISICLLLIRVSHDYISPYIPPKPFSEQNFLWQLRRKILDLSNFRARYCDSLYKSFPIISKSNDILMILGNHLSKQSSQVYFTMFELITSSICYWGDDHVISSRKGPSFCLNNNRL